MFSGQSMLKLSTACRQVGLKELISSITSRNCVKDESGGLSLLLRRWAATITARSTRDLDTRKKVMPGNVVDRQQGTGFHLYSYILATHQLEAGSMVMNCDQSKSLKTSSLQPSLNANSNPQFIGIGNRLVGDNQLASSHSRSAAYRHGILDPNSQVGNCIPLADIRMGTLVHNIECHPGQGAKLARSAGTYAKVVKEPGLQCLLRLPSGVEKLVDSRCRATVGVVSNPNHGVHKLRKAGQTRWLGRRPVVRGVAMNPVDHPHGGGEGRTKGGRPSVSPWGKPTKAGYKTVIRKHRL